MSAELSAELQGKTALLTSLYGQLPVGVAIFDLDLRLQHANASWASFVEYATGIPTAELIPGVSLIDVMRADDDFLSALQLVRGGQVIQKTDRPFPGPAGETSTCAFHARARRDRAPRSRR